MCCGLRPVGPAAESGRFGGIRAYQTDPRAPSSQCSHIRLMSLEERLLLCLFPAFATEDGFREA